MRRFARAHPIVTFYVLAFGISWAGYVPLFGREWGISVFGSRLWLGLLVLPAMGPALAAWVAGGLAGDAGGGLARLGASLRVPVGWGWWVGALAGPAGLLALANLISRAVWPGGRADGQAASGMEMAAVLGVSLCANFWEEVGWRGFALVRLQRRYQPVVAAGIVGVLWALWHAPLLVLPGSSMAGLPVGPWSAGTMSHSVILAWLFNRTRRNLGVVTVFHVSLNVLANVLGVRSRVVLAVVEVSAAVVVIWISRGRLGYVVDEAG